MLCILWYIFRTLSIIVNSDISGMFKSCSEISSLIVAYLEHCITLAYSKPCHIQNTNIFRTQDVFKTLSRNIMAYSERSHIKNPAIFRTWAYLGPKPYSESCLFRHSQAYSIIVIITLTFFFQFDLAFFSTKFKKICFWILNSKFQYSTESR